jgi:hypothetical protein
MGEWLEDGLGTCHFSLDEEKKIRAFSSSFSLLSVSRPESRLG